MNVKMKEKKYSLIESENLRIKEMKRNNNGKMVRKKDIEKKTMKA